MAPQRPGKAHGSTCQRAQRCNCSRRSLGTAWQNMPKGFCKTGIFIGIEQPCLKAGLGMYTDSHHPGTPNFQNSECWPKSQGMDNACEVTLASGFHLELSYGPASGEAEFARTSMSWSNRKWVKQHAINDVEAISEARFRSIDWIHRVVKIHPRCTSQLPSRGNSVIALLKLLSIFKLCAQLFSATSPISPVLSRNASLQ